MKFLVVVLLALVTICSAENQLKQISKLNLGFIQDKYNILLINY